MPASDPNPRILIADDHAIIRTGLKYLLRDYFNVRNVTQADSCHQLHRALEEKSYTHLILDLQLGDCNSIAHVADIRKKYPDLAIMIYTMSSEVIFGNRLLRLGALSFLSKMEDEKNVRDALHLFLLKRPYNSSGLTQPQGYYPRDDRNDLNPFDALSERETTVMTYLLQGMGVKEISYQLSLKMSTIATYKVRIFDKLGVTNTIELARLADTYNVQKS